jgi:hypothetical protein
MRLPFMSLHRTDFSDGRESMGQVVPVSGHMPNACLEL